MLILDPAASAPWLGHGLANALARRGCRVHIVSGAHWNRTIGDSLPRQYTLSRPFYRWTQQRAYDAETPLTRWFWQGLRLFGHVWKLAQLLPTVWWADLVHIQFLPLPTLDHLWLKLVAWRTPVVFVVHDAMPHEYFHAGFTAAVRRRLYAVPQKLIAHNESTAAELRRDFGVPAERILKLPYGAFEHMRDLVRGLPEPAAHPPRILFLGQINPRKGLDVLLRAAVRLHRRGVAFRLRVMGFPRMDMEPMFRLVRESGISDQVDFDLGWWPEIDIARSVHDAHVVALPYRIVSQSAVATVAFTLGRPVVGTDAGGMPELLRAADGGIIVPSEDDAALAEALERVLLDPALRARLGANAARYAAEELDWDVLAGHILEAYREVLPPRARERAGDATLVSAKR